MRIILFEDDQASKLYPVSLSRPICTIHCGSYSLCDWFAEAGAQATSLVRPHLRDVLEADLGLGLPPAGATHDAVMYVNAAAVPSLEVIRTLQSLAATGEACLVRHQQRVAAAIVPAGTELPASDLGAAELGELLTQLPLPRREVDVPLFEYPHDIIRHHMQCLGSNLQHRLARGDYQQRADGVFVAEGAQISEHCVYDTSRGPIVVESGAKIGPYVYLAGPVHVGRNARILEHAAIKDAVALGHTTKIGGEVEASIIEPYTNKQHHGFLGHSYLGSWINLGAGTCNSDLKNTYGVVNMEYQGQKVPTGMQFIGAIVGDYAKSAINTGIFTGKVIGACSMVYGFVTTNVPSFVNYARLFGQVTETPVKVLIDTQARMFARRNVAQRPCDVQLLNDMYELTRHERQLGAEALML
jgi:glucose-1-phosphate thymidylyltransferase